MKFLIVYCHPNPKSFCHALLEAVADKLKESGHELQVRDLYGIKFDPILSSADFMTFQEGRIPTDILAEQQYITWADTIIFIYPLWWGGFPAVLKGYIDRTFAHGFAFAGTPTGPKGLLGGKQVLALTPQGESKEKYEKQMWPAMKMTIDCNVFEFSGMKVLEHVHFEQVPAVSDAARKEYLRQVEQIISNIV